MLSLLQISVEELFLEFGIRFVLFIFVFGGFIFFFNLSQSEKLVGKKRTLQGVLKQELLDTVCWLVVKALENLTQVKGQLLWVNSQHIFGKIVSKDLGIFVVLLDVFQQNLDMWHFPVHQLSAVLEFTPPLFVHIVNKNGEKLLRINHKLACLFNHLAENADKHLFL